MTDQAYVQLLQKTCSHPYSGQTHRCPKCGYVSPDRTETATLDPEVSLPEPMADSIACHNA